MSPAVTRHRAAVEVAQVLRHQQPGEVASDRFVPAVAERALGGGVEFDDLPVMIDRDDAVERRFEHALSADARGFLIRHGRPEQQAGAGADAEKHLQQHETLVAAAGGEGSNGVHRAPDRHD